MGQTEFDGVFDILGIGDPAFGQLTGAFGFGLLLGNIEKVIFGFTHYRVNLTWFPYRVIGQILPTVVGKFCLRSWAILAVGRFCLRATIACGELRLKPQHIAVRGEATVLA